MPAMARATAASEPRLDPLGWAVAAGARAAAARSDERATPCARTTRPVRA